MTRPIPHSVRQQVITFDAGQTLIELDLDFLATRAGERGHAVSREALAGALPAAWSHYDTLVDAGADHVAGWQGLMSNLLGGAGIDDPGPLTEWLWSQNSRANLWRRPIPDMVDLARELGRRGAIVGVLSNSEGQLAELLAEVGIADAFHAIIDSGRLGFEKPDRRIFDHTLAVLGAPASAVAIHVGDSWSADIAGARGAGWRAIWYGRRAAPVDDEGVAIARTAADVRDAIARWTLS